MAQHVMSLGPVGTATWVVPPPRRALSFQRSFRMEETRRKVIGFDAGREMMK